MALNKRIVLGSGKLYYAPFTGTYNEATVASIETDDNLLGLIKGGATLSYEPEFYTAQDDLGLAVKKMLTSEEVTLESGIMTWNAKTLKTLVSTGRVTESDGKRTLKVGGAQNYDDAKYILRFVHSDSENGDIKVTIVGQNESGFELAFAQDEETVIDATFTAFPMDDEGTLLIFEEDTSKPANAAKKAQ